MQARVNFGIGYHYRDPLKTEGWYIIEDDYIVILQMILVYSIMQNLLGNASIK